METRLMKWTHIVMLIVFAALCFGGTFTCKSNDDATSTSVSTGGSR